LAITVCSDADGCAFALLVAGFALLVAVLGAVADAVAVLVDDEDDSVAHPASPIATTAALITMTLFNALPSDSGAACALPVLIEPFGT
jgi:hypothetical protein